MEGVEEVSIARVVVDVPVTRTDRPFDYRVPPSLQGFVQVGSRVMVPFGPRKLQGFVIELGNEAQFSLEKVRDIEEILDIETPLTPELVQLAKWMHERFMSTYYGALQVMIPSALRSKYEKRISLIEKPGEYEILPPVERELYDYLTRYSPVAFDTFMKRFPFAALWVKEGIKKGVLKAEDNLVDRLGKKKITILSPAVSIEQLTVEREALGKQAYRQREMLSYFIEGPPEVSLPQLLADLGTSSQTVKSLLDKGLLQSREMEDYRDPFANRTFKKAEKYPFTPQQEKVIEGIDQGRRDFGYFPCLIHGVTGSGKTEVYLEIMERTIAEGKEAILLVPEISLTPQMVNRFKGRLGDKVAVMHSALSQGERYDEWRKIRRGQVKVAIGARSAIFAPFTNLGLIIIDEEHEGSYKQEETPRYHARSVAHYRGRANDACVIVGSATPSLESYDQAVRGKITLFTMADRVGNRPLPQVEIVDMRGELRDGNRSMFSKPLREAID
ncbi:MAG TPA: primosomal protein N', partial [Paenibacillaceae bacterium]|nr:primosomal protein N' [Paenibacillaceae bacterium]